jgi:aminopeptidase N
VGRERFDRALATWFRNFRFQSVTTADFRRFVKRELGAPVDLEEWLAKPGIPASAPRPRAAAFDAVDSVAAAWRKQTVPSANTRRWSTHEWLRLVRAVSDKPDANLMARLDAAYNLTARPNAEIRFEWLRASIRAGYRPGLAKLDDFLARVGRRKFAKPLYEELAKSEAGKRRAREIFAKARAGYHPITQSAVEAALR